MFDIGLEDGVEIDFSMKEKRAAEERDNLSERGKEVHDYIEDVYKFDTLWIRKQQAEYLMIVF